MITQSKQEPVAHIPLKALEQIKSPMLVLNNVPIYGYSAEGTVAVYTHPPQRKPLTKEEMFEAIRPLYSSDKAARLTVNHSEDEYRAIEAAHGIKGDA